MVRKISNGEYLKRVDNMTAVERAEYLSRVGDWLSVSGQCLVSKGEVFEARLQNVLQVSLAWNDAECAAFEEGAVLLSALVGVADTKLPELLYAISAKRSVKRMFQLLWEIEASAAGNGHWMHGEKPAADAAGAVTGRPAADAAGTAADHGGETAGYTTGAVPVRPKHIDQYIHLLPKKTQEHADLVQGLYRELDEAREKLRLLASDASASAADREAWAKKATKCDNTLRKIFDELDAEWAKLVKQGRVVVDDLGNARVMPTADAGDTAAGDGESAEGDGENADEVQGDGATELTLEQKARRRELRKWLTDTRRGNGAAREERVKQWYVNFREYLTLEGDKAFDDEKIKEAARHYEINIDDITAMK